MKITKLEKKKRLYLMELDEQQTSYITEDTIVRFMLSRDKVISKEELTEIQDFAQFSYGKNLALYHLSFKARTEKEVREYLKKYDIDKNIVSQVIANLKEDKWINDGQYAYAIINTNQLSGDKGPYVLTHKLAQKGISKSTIEENLKEFDFSEVAQRVANKLLKKYEGKLPSRALQDKIIQNLTNKGFSYSDAKIAFDDLDSQVNQETIQELIL
ncbi:TPA: recombination regulator RecX, partial [Streptococcus pneumoniae]|nr:recombination regulator RecX [Streptococcus pneumoniae]